MSRLDGIQRLSTANVYDQGIVRHGNIRHSYEPFSDWIISGQAIKLPTDLVQAFDFTRSRCIGNRCLPESTWAEHQFVAESDRAFVPASSSHISGDSDPALFHLGLYGKASFEKDQ